MGIARSFGLLPLLLKNSYLLTRLKIPFFFNVESIGIISVCNCLKHSSFVAIRLSIIFLKIVSEKQSFSLSINSIVSSNVNLPIVRSCSVGCQKRLKNIFRNTGILCHLCSKIKRTIIVGNQRFIHIKNYCSYHCFSFLKVYFSYSITKYEIIITTNILFTFIQKSYLLSVKCTKYITTLAIDCISKTHIVK